MGQDVVVTDWELVIVAGGVVWVDPSRLEDPYCYLLSISTAIGVEM